MPLNYSCTSYKYDVPFGVIEREEMDMDVPGLSFAAGVRREDGKKAVMLFADRKYGFRCVEDSMAVTLIRSSFNPDPYPEFGSHSFSLDILLVDNKCNKELLDISYALSHPVSVISAGRHKGSLPPAGSFIKLEEGSVMISAVKMPEGNTGGRQLMIRLNEVEGKKTMAVLGFNNKIKNAYYADINENRVDEGLQLRFEGGKLMAEIQIGRAHV